MRIAAADDRALSTGGLTMRLVPRIAALGTTSIFIKRDAYEPELRLIRRFIRPGDVMLDIGANYGVFALFMASYVGHTGHVHAFEPGGFSFGELSANVAMNDVGSRITTYRLGAASTPGTLRLYHLAGSPVNFRWGRPMIRSRMSPSTGSMP